MDRRALTSKYTSEKEIDWTPEEDGVYKIWVDVKDEDGNKEYKCISINIKK